MQESATDSYLSFFLSSVFSKSAQSSAFALFFLFLGRMLPIIAFSPFFGARVLPNPSKVMLAITLFVIFLPTLLVSVKTSLEFDESLILFLIKEIFVGGAIGFMMGLPFLVAQSVGLIVDHQRGGSSLMVNDPTMQNQSSPLGTLFNMVLIYIFYTINGPFLFIEAIINSYNIIPPDQFLNSAFFTKNSPFWATMIQLLNQLMVLSIQLAAPALLAILMTDMFLGIANRLAPQVQITFLGMPLKSLLGLAVICFGWFLMVGEFRKQAFLWLQQVITTINLFKYGST